MELHAVLFGGNWILVYILFFSLLFSPHIPKLIGQQPVMDKTVTIRALIMEFGCQQPVIL